MKFAIRTKRNFLWNYGTSFTKPPGFSSIEFTVMYKSFYHEYRNFDFFSLLKLFSILKSVALHAHWQLVYCRSILNTMKFSQDSAYMVMHSLQQRLFLLERMQYFRLMNYHEFNTLIYIWKPSFVIGFTSSFLFSSQ